ncbi:MAG: glycoside hydrolase family protein [Desulfobacterales bacterium]|jgi:lysozyme|nr:glycoside hydrolase family protein [Desulfobacterales bacterium]
MLNQAIIVATLQQNEGFRGRPYRCSAGKLTIGYGRNIEEVGIKHSEALLMLMNDIEEVSSDLKTIFRQWDTMPPGRQLAMIDMRYQLGATGFRGFKKMLSAISAGNWQDAAAQIKDSRYYRQVPARARRVIRMVETGAVESI